MLLVKFLPNKFNYWSNNRRKNLHQNTTGWKASDKIEMHDYEERIQ
jgi:hypothetical protein